MLTIPPILGEVIDLMKIGLGDTVPVVHKIPGARPNSFVRLLQLASERESVAHATVTILAESWATSQSDADLLGAKVYGILSSIDAPSGIFAPRNATASGPYPSDDPDAGSPRSICVVRLIVPVKTVS